MTTRAAIDSFIFCLGGYKLGRRDPIYFGIPGVSEPITFSGQWQRRALGFHEVRDWLINRGADKCLVDECWKLHGEE